MRTLIATIAGLMLLTTAAAAQDPDKGAALYKTHCAECHGIDAGGDGPLAGALLIKPTDLTALAKANGGEFPLERVLRRIDGTDPLVSHGSPMPVFGPYFEGVANTPMKLKSGQPIMVSDPIADLVSHILTLQEGSEAQ
ncbi:cytochrome c [Marivita sp. GX14005]|uniref:c-type cytochrome n=1 Tax=Marivita sp. GX14005 TaxID=2942276 RepID=UPI002019A946|nr:cytochrome c [Marivita sp. GX14005]MCL3881054.1 cytochrome c [Marivita sp. GX14005]